MIRSRVGSLVRASGEAYRISASVAKGIMLLPFPIVFVYSALLVLPVTRQRALAMLEENSHVEMLTFACLLLGGVLGLVLAWKARGHGERPLVVAFYALFSLGLLFAAMEEVAWGQAFLRFRTPSFWSDINIQHETTIHNIAGMHGHTEFLRLAFGLGGLLSLRLYSHASLRKMGSPSMLWTWFAIISALAGMDLFADYVPIHARLEFFIWRMSEVVEMMIGMAGLLFVWLNSRMLRSQWKRDPAASWRSGS